MQIMCMIILLMAFIWPSVWEWKAMDLVILVSNIDQRLDKNALRNSLSPYEIMECGIPKCTHTHSKKSLVVAFAVILFLQVAIMAILENLSMTMKIQLLSCLVEGRLDM